MQTVTDLNDLFSYSLFPLLILGGILFGIIIYKLVTRKKHKITPPTIIIPNNQNKAQIKAIYLSKLNNLFLKCQNGAISNRHAYQQLSALIRNFIFEMTNIRVQNYTLEEIQRINIPILYELVKEFYNPEFEKISEGNISSSIEKTRKVIELWN